MTNPHVPMGFLCFSHRFPYGFFTGKRRPKFHQLGQPAKLLRVLEGSSQNYGKSDFFPMENDGFSWDFMGYIGYTLW